MDAIDSITIIKLLYFITAMEIIESNDKYFQGILQLRNCSEEALDFVMEMIESENVRISKEVRRKDGYDLFLSSNKFLKKIGKQLKARFPGILKQTAKLHTEDKQAGRKIYRGTILFRMPSFNVGDKGTFRGDDVKVLSIGEKVMLQNLKTGKKKRHEFEEVEKHFKA
jgi:NMD protein affecting ribosome stability and mRNA decay